MANTKNLTPKQSPIISGKKDKMLKKVWALLDHADTLEENGCDDDAKKMRKAVDSIAKAILKL